MTLQIEPSPAQLPVEPALEDRLKTYEALLLKWQPKMNLVAPSTLKAIRQRHIEDSLQVFDALPGAKVWADIGSGGGFPGLVTAMRLSGVAGGVVHLIESDHRKCAFLREVSRETMAPAEIHRGRIEEVLPTLPHLDAISARALSSMAQLMEMTHERLENGSIGVFLKGQDVASDLTKTPIYSKILFRFLQSRTEPQGVIVLAGLADLIRGGVGP
jgi:16S rRNA (guanine527-N7)-methyltransferase